MSIEVIGGGLGRTGTSSLKHALERLLGAPCYHMVETFDRPRDLQWWQAADAGREPDWDELFAGYRAAIDWPAVAFWRELTAHYPDAVVVLSVRESPEAWWRSMERTIVDAVGRPSADPEQAERRRLMSGILERRFTPGWRERDAAIAAYERHNESVRATVPARQLVEWQPRDGWAPLCERLGRPIPDVPFPHSNTTAEFRDHSGLDG
jgi:sulfotransferase family protein